jgi:hypothetical protein
VLLFAAGGRNTTRTTRVRPPIGSGRGLRSEDRGNSTRIVQANLEESIYGGSYLLTSLRLRPNTPSSVGSMRLRIQLWAQRPLEVPGGL